MDRPFCRRRRVTARHHLREGGRPLRPSVRVLLLVAGGRQEVPAGKGRSGEGSEMEKRQEEVERLWSKVRLEIEVAVFWYHVLLDDTFSAED